jgi:hypothetical protein
MPTFQNTLSVWSVRSVHFVRPPMKMEQSVPKRWHLNSRNRGVSTKCTVCTDSPVKMEQSVLKHWHLNSRRRGTTQKETT